MKYIVITDFFPFKDMNTRSYPCIVVQQNDDYII